MIFSSNHLRFDQKQANYFGGKQQYLILSEFFLSIIERQNNPFDRNVSFHRHLYIASNERAEQSIFGLLH